MFLHIFALYYYKPVGLEDEIKQQKFKTEYQKLTVNIIYTANWLNDLIAKSMKVYDISPEQYNILRILRGRHPNPVTVNVLMERMLNKMSNVSRLVEKLRKKNLVERKISKEDRRACDIVITKRGLDLLTELHKEEEKWNSSVSALTMKEAREINCLLDKIRG